MQQNPNLFAGLGPFAGLTQAATESLSRGVGGLFGIKDPVMERNRILSQVNYNDPASLQSAAQELARAGFVDQAVQLAGQGRKLTQQERQFGLESRRVAATEEQVKNQQLNQAARLSLDKEQLELKRNELKLRQGLTDAQVDKIYAEIDKIDQGDYYIVEQKGGPLGNETQGFIAINKRNPEDRKTIPLVMTPPLEVTGKPSVVPPTSAWQYVPGKGMVKNESK
jgi:hypothetical protein